MAASLQNPKHAVTPCVIPAAVQVKELQLKIEKQEEELEWLYKENAALEKGACSVHSHCTHT